METEAHVYALSIAASVLLSFFPFLIVMVSLFRHVLEWPAAERVIYLTLNDYFPGTVGEFVARNLRETVNSRGPMQIASLFLLLFTANGIFEPLEVALNRLWGAAQNRPYWRNQLVSLGLIFICGGLAFASYSLTALNQQWFPIAGQPQVWMVILFFKAAALPLSIFALFLVYWLLPNRRIPPVEVLPHAILVGIALEALKYMNLLVWPFVQSKIKNEYGPFQNSVTIVLWSFLAALVVLAGAEWSSRRARIRVLIEEER